MKEVGWCVHVFAQRFVCSFAYHFYLKVEGLGFFLFLEREVDLVHVFVLRSILWLF